MELPINFKERINIMLDSEYTAFLKCFEEDNYVGLRLNPRKSSSFDIIKEFECTPISWCSNGYYYNSNTSPGKHPLHNAGAYYIQEPSAMSVVELLNPIEGDLVCDLCASPGGKSTQIALKIGNEGLLVSNEIHPTRAKTLSQNIERLGLTNCIVTNNPPAKIAKHFGSIFDKVLVDAPCSGEGMFRKNNLAIDEWSEQNSKMCHTRQLEILESADKLLKANGILCYSTCTFAPIENEATINEFLKTHPNYKVLQPIHQFDNGNAKFINSDNNQLNKTVRIWPHHTKGEGHYIALLQKLEGSEVKLKYHKEKVFHKMISTYETWQKANLTIKLHGDYITFGDNLYLAPYHNLDITNLKVLRYGLHLGSVTKNVFEPSHSLALALSPTQVKNIIDIDYSTAVNYLKGNTLNYDCENGWNLIVYENCPLGWGKSTNGLVKNHYPKGLRI